MTSEKTDFKQTHLPHRKLLLRKLQFIEKRPFSEKHLILQIWAKGFIQQMTRHVSYRVTSCHDLWGHPRTSDPISNPEAWKWPGTQLIAGVGGLGDFWWENCERSVANRWDGLEGGVCQGGKLMWVDVGWCFSICLDRLEAFSPNIS